MALHIRERVHITSIDRACRLDQAAPDGRVGFVPGVDVALGELADVPGYSFAALAAFISAAEAEHDFGGWLADLLCRAAAYLGSADHLVMGRSGSWEAQHVTALVRNTAGPLPSDLDRFKDGGPQ